MYNFLAKTVVVLILGVFLALLVMLLWNWLMPTIFGFKTIGFLQAWGLHMLSYLLFKFKTNLPKIFFEK